MSSGTRAAPFLLLRGLAGAKRKSVRLRHHPAMSHARSIVFLPGAGGSAGFWEPVAGRLPASWDRALLGLPGAGDEPHEPGVESFEDVIEFATSQFSGRSDLVAQSMGGVVAVGVDAPLPREGQAAGVGRYLGRDRRRRARRGRLASRLSR